MGPGAKELEGMHLSALSLITLANVSDTEVNRIIFSSYSLQSIADISCIVTS